MSALVFLADVHLSEETPEISNAFFSCIDTLCAQSPAGVFILGDLFNVWIGDKLSSHYIDQVAREIKKLSKVCPVFFQRGNRDFLISKNFASKSGMTLLPDIYQFDYDNQNIIIEHGDLLCTDDLSYQRMRKILRHKWLIQLAALTPRFLNQWVANKIRNKSKRATKQKSQKITDVNAKAVQERFAKSRADILIHGHTHRPNIHHYHNKIRYVLGDWRPRGEVLIYENHNWALEFI